MLDSIRLIVNAPANYATRLACHAEEVRAAQALRFEVFNLELNEGLAQSYESGLDEDPFDAVCDHLLVEHRPSRQIVGTYRLQTGVTRRRNWVITARRNLIFRPTKPPVGKLSSLAAPASTFSIEISLCSDCCGKA